MRVNLNLTAPHCAVGVTSTSCPCGRVPLRGDGRAAVSLIKFTPSTNCLQCGAACVWYSCFRYFEAEFAFYHRPNLADFPFDLQAYGTR